MTTFITGDRQLTVLYPGQVAVEIMRALAAGESIATGDNDGVESVVRAFADQAGFAVELVPTPLLEGDARWDARHSNLPAGTKVVAVHADPMSSHVVTSAMRVVPEELFRLVTPADAL